MVHNVNAKFNFVIYLYKFFFFLRAYKLCFVIKKFIIFKLSLSNESPRQQQKEDKDKIIHHEKKKKKHHHSFPCCKTFLKIKVDLYREKRRRRNMAWLARSIANTLRLDDEEEDAAAEDDEEKKIPDVAVPRPTPNDAVLAEDRPRDSTLYTEDRRLSDSDGDASYNHGGDEDLDGDNDQARGVKEDLSEFRDSLTRQFWGVASFLAPPPPPPPPPPLRHRSGSLPLESKSDVAGPGNDDEEEEEDEELVEYDERESGQFGELANSSPSNDYYTNIVEDAIGITEEVLAFARNIAHHPETWLDFPLSEEEEFDGEEI